MVREDPGLKPFSLELFQGPEGPCSHRFALSREGFADDGVRVGGLCVRWWLAGGGWVG